MKALVLGFALVACTSFAPPAPPSDTKLLPRDGQGLALSEMVASELIALMRRAVRDQIEPAACVSQWRIWFDTVNGDPHENVDVYSLTLADIDSADVLNVWWHQQLCGNTLPSVHGHVWRQESVPYPSERDVETAQRVSRAPFHLLLFRVEDDSTFGVRLYGVRP